MKKTEKTFILGLLLLALVLWAAMHFLRPQNYGIICITVNGEEYGTYSLAEDQIISIGETNVCQIKDGKVSMTQANCPDHLCIRQGAIDDSGGMIVCLPNKVTIEGIRKAESQEEGIDSIA